jgi:hypothetical protein
MSVEHFTPHAAAAHAPALRKASNRTGAPRRAATWTRLFALTATLAAVLAGCGGGSGGGSALVLPPPASGAPAAPPPDAPTGPVANRTLVIDLDGATYAAVQAGIAGGTLPNLGKLEVRLAYSGGMAGTPGQQPTLDTPGWATLLTGGWASRHQVMSQAPRQVVRGATVFQMAKGKNTGRTARRSRPPAWRSCWPPTTTAATSTRSPTARPTRPPPTA